MIGWKLFRKRKDGSYGTLFIDQTKKLYTGVIYPAEDHPTKGFAHRPGWHILANPESNRLADNSRDWCKNRVWCKVEIELKEVIYKPVSQGGTVYLGNWIKILEEMN